MSLAEQLPLAEVRNRLSEVVEQVETQHARVTITKHGRPADRHRGVNTWEVAWTPPTAIQSLALLPEKVVAATIEFVYGPLAQNPFRAGKPLRFDLEGLHAGRRGDYRVTYGVDVGAERIIVHAIQHRADAYRRR